MTKAKILILLSLSLVIQSLSSVFIKFAGQYEKEHPEEIYRISELELENAGHVSDSSSRIGYYITVKDQL